MKTYYSQLLKTLFLGLKLKAYLLNRHKTSIHPKILNKYAYFFRSSIFYIASSWSVFLNRNITQRHVAKSSVFKRVQHIRCRSDEFLSFFQFFCQSFCFGEFKQSWNLKKQTNLRLLDLFQPIKQRSKRKTRFKGYPSCIRISNANRRKYNRQSGRDEWN